MAGSGRKTGKFYAFDFSPTPVAPQIAAAYSELATDYSPRDILVLKRIPCNLDTLADHIQSDLGLQIRPNVQSLPQYASHVVEINDPTIDRLAYEQRIELLAEVIDETDWTDLVDEATSQFSSLRWPDNHGQDEIIAFFQQASEQESFGRDIGQVLLEATREGGFNIDEDGSPCHVLIAALACLNDRFHDRLDSHGLVERANIIPRATAALADDTTYEQARSEFNAVLALEFEEYTAQGSQFVAALTADVELVAIGERNASIQRTMTESGDLDTGIANCVIDFDEGTPPAPDDDETPAVSDPGRIAAFLATGSGPEAEVSATHLTAPTFREQIATVANEIEYLRHEHGTDYSEFAVVVNRLGDQLSDARRHLRAAGVPTRAVGAPALSEDPAVTEIYAFVQYLLNRDTAATTWLMARVDDFSEELAEACHEGSLETTLNRWIVNTDLKKRVATGDNYIEVQEQFQNIQRIIDLARFIDGTTLLDSDLPTLKRVLDRTIRFDASYTHTIETAPRMHGVTVTDIRGVKHDSFETVFLLNVVDEEYPGRERLTPLFPKPWLQDMPEYPAITGVDTATIADTFATQTGELSTSPFDTYYHHRERRKLALGARAATERLYLCTFESREDGLGRTYNPSRFLYLLMEQDEITVEELSAEGSDRPIRTRQGVAEFILEQPWAELEQVVNAAHTGETAELEDTEEVFGVIEALLADDDVHPEFADAVASQFALARGEVISGD